MFEYKSAFLDNNEKYTVAGPEHKKLIKTAVKYWTEHTCVQWKERTDQVQKETGHENYLMFIPGRYGRSHH